MIIKLSELLLLGWELERKVGDHIVLELRGYTLKRWENKIEIYRTGLPCALVVASVYSYQEMWHLMVGLKMIKAET